MTRASLLHILDHVTGISDVEIRELEQLAAAFPYCQTAHVLLAKAAHDRGSMLAGQRLRRAATYAADRDLLRQLLESAAAVVPFQPVTDEPAVPATSLEPARYTVAEEKSTSERMVSEISVQEAVSSAPAADVLPPAAEQPTAEQQPELRTEVPEAEQPVGMQAEAAPTENPASGLTREDEALFTSKLPDLPESPAGPAASETAPELPADEEPAFSPPKAPATASGELPDHLSETPAVGPAPAPGPEPTAADDLLPAVAPPIRPPADAGISRFEFGLGQSALPAPVAYQLPGLEEEEDEELPTLSKLPVTPQPLVTAPFRADADLGYALGAGSRLGYDLQARDGYTLDLPLDAFFEPDALLLAHLKAHKPKPAASSFDLINRFLKTQPRIKTPAGVPLPAEQQPDLSVRSANVAPALASESLAKIMVRQGKKDKAIEIYERLMERQPEKKAYFAEQIQQLQQPSE